MTQATETKPETAVAVRAPQSMALVPRSIQEAAQLADRLSQSSLLPVALRGKPGDVLVILLKGQELGLAPMQALSSIHVIQGKAVCEAALMVGLCLSHPDVCAYFTLVESTSDHATYETLRRGAPEPVRMSYTFEQAKTAKLTAKDNWTNHRDAMLRARASSALARAVYPDLVSGIYTPDEAAEFREEPRPVRVPPVATVKRVDIPTGTYDVPDTTPAEIPAAEILLEPPAEGQPENVSIGAIAEIQRDARTGKSKNGPWSLHRVVLEMGEEFGTFSASEADLAEKIQAEGVPARIVWKRTPKGNLEIEEIARAF